MKVLILSTAVALYACVGCQSGESKPADTGDPKGAVGFKEPDAFYDLLRLTTANYMPLSAEQMFAQSTFVGTGKVVDVQEGMEVRSLSAKVPTSLYTLVIDFEVDGATKGDSYKGHVYFEYIHGGAFSVETYRMNKPADLSLVFLAPSDWSDSPDVEYIGRERGYPAGAQLYRLTTPQGWIVEKGAGVSQPLDETAPLFGSAKSLVDAEQAVKAMAESQPSEGTARQPDAG